MEGAAQPEMPKYRSHKEVRALKIKTLEALPDGGLLITPADAGYEQSQYIVPKEFVPLHDPARPSVGWYYVVYENGYKSFSPPEAFEQGYTRI